MAGCITQDYKDIISGMIQQEMEKEVMLALVKAIPLCEQQRGVTPARREVTRKVPEPWGIEPVYIDAGGRERTVSSPSALVKELGLPMSGIQCDPSGVKCKAMSTIDILRIHGYTVSGNGEPRKAAEGGKKLTVYHPDAPTMPQPEKAPPKKGK